jgi:hypothetical protein
MMRTGSIIVLMCLVAGGPSTAQNSTTGSCSPIVTQNRGPVTIECSGVPEQLQRQFVEILNTILQKQLDPAAVMGKLDEISKGVGELKRKSMDAERGIASFYEYNGAKHDQVGSHFTVQTTPQMVAFQKMLELVKAGQLRELAILCEEQIVAAPTWLTPYYFAGGAYFDLGDKWKALDRLEYVVEHAGSDPTYSRAAALLRQIKSQP